MKSPNCEHIKNIVFVLGAGDNQLRFIQEFKSLGYRVLSVDINPNAPGKNLTDIFWTLSTHDPGPIIAQIAQSSLKDRITAISCPTTGIPYLTAAKIASYLSVEFLTENAVFNILDKFRLWETLKAQNLTTRKCANSNNIYNEIKIFNKYPVVVKPKSYGGLSKGVYYCNNQNEIKDSIKKASKLSPDRLAIAEDFCYGEEYKYGGFIQNGKIKLGGLVSRTFSKGAPGVPISLFTEANEFVNEKNITINTFIEGFCAAAGISSAFLNIDIIVNDNTIELIDVDIVPGSFSFLLESALGINVYKMSAWLSLGEDLQILNNIQKNESAAVFFLWCHYIDVKIIELFRICSEVSKQSTGVFVPDNSVTQNSLPYSESPLRLGIYYIKGSGKYNAFENGTRWLKMIQEKFDQLGKKTKVVMPEIQ